MQGEGKEVVGEGGPAALHVQEAVEGGRDAAVRAKKVLCGGLVVVQNDNPGGKSESHSLSLSVLLGMPFLCWNDKSMHRTPFSMWMEMIIHHLNLEINVSFRLFQ